MGDSIDLITTIKELESMQPELRAIGEFRKANMLTFAIGYLNKYRALLQKNSEYDKSVENSGMIYTSFYDAIPYISKDIVPISIAGRCKDGYTGIEYKKLAPKKDFFLKWKETGDNDYYIKNYHELVLDKLNPVEVVDELFKLSKGKDICLLCWETSEKFCHRHLVAQWLNNYGYQVEEYLPDIIM